MGILLVAVAGVALGGASFAERTSAVSGAPFLAKALGSPATQAPLTREVAPHLAVTIGRAGFTVNHHEASVSLAGQYEGTARWQRFENGVSRRTRFGLDTIVVDREKAEQFLTVDERQGLKVWQWSLRARNLVAR